MVKGQVYTGLTSAENGRPCEIGRLEYPNGLVVLFHRYTDGRIADSDSQWRPTWACNLNTDPHGKGAARFPKGLLYAGGEALLHLANAKSISSFESEDGKRYL